MEGYPAEVPPVAVRVAAERIISAGREENAVLVAALGPMFERSVYLIAELMLTAVVDDPLAGADLVVAVDRMQRERVRRGLAS